MTTLTRWFKIAGISFRGRVAPKLDRALRRGLGHNIRVGSWAAVLIGFAVITVVTSGAAGGTAAAPEFVGVLALTVEADVAEQLGLTESQKQKLLELIEARESEALELAIQVKGLPPAERSAKLAPFQQESESRGLAMLSKQQRARLQQIRVARWGLAGSLDAAAAERLKLSTQQQGQVAELLRDQTERLARADEKTAQIIRSETDRKVSSMLDPQQRAALQSLSGVAVPSASASDATTASPPAIPAREDAAKARPLESQAARLPETKSQDAAKVALSEAAAKAAPPQESGKGATALPASSVAAKTASPPSTGSAASPADVGPIGEEEETWEDLVDQFGNESDEKVVVATKTLTPAKSSDRLKFNFRYQPWKDVLDWFAETADLSLVGDNFPKGTFNYSDSREYTPAEAIDLLNSVLLTKGYTLIRRGRMVMIVNLEDGIPPNLIDRLSPEELDKRGDYELVEVQFQLQNISPEEAEQEIRKLIGPQGSVTVLPKARQVLIRETAGRLRAIRQVIQSLENPQGAAARIRPIEIKYAEPQDILNLLRQLLDIPADKNTSTDGSVHILLDPSGGRLLVTGKPEAVARVEEAVKALDVPDPANPQKTRLGDAAQLEVYAVNGADPTSALQVLQTLLVGMPEVRLSVDPKTGNLIALGRRAAHATIKATLEQLQHGDSRRLEVFQLRTLDPQLAVAAITKLFGSDAGPGSPKIDADPYSKQLLVRGNESQIAQIRSMLEQMGESVTGKAIGGNMRVVPLTGRAARTAIEQLQEVWSQSEVRENRIRIVTPSATGISTHRPSAPPEARPEQSSGSDRPGSPGLERQLAPEVLERLRRMLEPPADVPAPQPGTPRESQPTAPNAAPKKTATVPAQPAEAESAKSSDNKSAQQSEGAGRSAPIFRFATQLVAAETTARSADAATSKTAPPASPGQSKSGSAEAAKASSASPQAKPASPKGAAQGKEAAPIVITPSRGGVIITSRDQEALDEIERLLGTLAGNFLSGKPEFTVFYLKYAKAAALAETLDQILGGGTAASSGGGQSLVGDLAGAALGDVAGGLLGTLLSDGGGKPSGPVQITADSRLNALFVRAKPADLDTIEDLLKILDEKAGPEEVLASPKPQLIPVYNTQAEEIAKVVREVYQDRMTGSAGANRNPTPQDFIMAMRNMRGGRGGGGGAQRGAQEEQTKLSIGVDTRTNSLVVAAPDALFQEVKDLVEQLDRAAIDSSQVLQVVSLKQSSSDTIRQALSAMMGSSVQFGSTSSSSTTAGNTSQPSPYGYGSRRFGYGGMGMGMGMGGFPGGGFGGFPGGGFPGGGFGQGGAPGMGFPGRFGGGGYGGGGGMFNPGSMYGGGMRGGMGMPGGGGSGGGSGRRSGRGGGG